jgi:hypothetical protein
MQFECEVIGNLSVWAGLRPNFTAERNTPEVMAYFGLFSLTALKRLKSLNTAGKQRRRRRNGWAVDIYLGQNSLLTTGGRALKGKSEKPTSENMRTQNS